TPPAHRASRVAWAMRQFTWAARKVNIRGRRAQACRSLIGRDMAISTSVVDSAVPQYGNADQLGKYRGGARAWLVEGRGPSRQGASGRGANRAGPWRGRTRSRDR